MPDPQAKHLLIVMHGTGVNQQEYVTAGVGKYYPRGESLGNIANSVQETDNVKVIIIDGPMTNGSDVHTKIAEAVVKSLPFMAAGFTNVHLGGFSRGAAEANTVPHLLDKVTALFTDTTITSHEALIRRLAEEEPVPALKQALLNYATSFQTLIQSMLNSEQVLALRRLLTAAYAPVLGQNEPEQPYNELLLEPVGGNIPGTVKPGYSYIVDKIIPEWNDKRMYVVHSKVKHVYIRHVIHEMSPFFNALRPSLQSDKTQENFSHMPGIHGTLCGALGLHQGQSITNGAGADLTPEVAKIQDLALYTAVDFLRTVMGDALEFKAESQVDNAAYPLHKVITAYASQSEQKQAALKLKLYNTLEQHIPTLAQAYTKSDYMSIHRLGIPFGRRTERSVATAASSYGTVNNAAVKHFVNHEHARLYIQAELQHDIFTSSAVGDLADDLVAIVRDIQGSLQSLSTSLFDEDDGMVSVATPHQHDKKYNKFFEGVDTAATEHGRVNDEKKQQILTNRAVYFTQYLASVLLDNHVTEAGKTKLVATVRSLMDMTADASTTDAGPVQIFNQALRAAIIEAVPGILQSFVEQYTQHGEQLQQKLADGNIIVSSESLFAYQQQLAGFNARLAAIQAMFADHIPVDQYRETIVGLQTKFDELIAQGAMLIDVGNIQGLTDTPNQTATINATMVADASSPSSNSTKDPQATNDRPDNADAAVANFLQFQQMIIERKRALVAQHKQLQAEKVALEQANQQLQAEHTKLVSQFQVVHTENAALQQANAELQQANQQQANQQQANQQLQDRLHEANDANSQALQQEVQALHAKLAAVNRQLELQNKSSYLAVTAKRDKLQGIVESATNGNWLQRFYHRWIRWRNIEVLKQKIAVLDLIIADLQKTDKTLPAIITGIRSENGTGTDTYTNLYKTRCCGSSHSGILVQKLCNEIIEPVLQQRIIQSRR